MGNGNMAVADKIFDPNNIDHIPIMETPDRDGLLKSVEAARSAFPDVKPSVVAEISEREWSQAKLVELLDVSRQTINAIEKRNTTPACLSLL